MIEIPDFAGTVEFQSYADVVSRINQFDRVYNIGKDQSGEYDMHLIELGTKGKPTLFITASMHPPEFHATQYSMQLMEDLRDNRFPDRDFRDFLLTNFCIAYIPVQNPYGFDRVTDPYLQFDPARYNVNGVDLNRDFYSLTQAESINVAEQIKHYQPFAFLDMHMFQPEYEVAYGSKFILANGQRETDYVRDIWRQSFEAYAGDEMTIWTNTLDPKSEVSRAFAARRKNPWTPHTLAYITEFAKPTDIDGERVALLTEEEIYKYGTASLYLFFKTSLDYFYLHNEKTDDAHGEQIYVRNINGDEFPLQATITNDLELNGNQSLSATIFPTKVNKAFIEDMTEMWEIVDFDDVKHKIIYAKKKGEGKTMTVDIKAIPLFFDVFDTLRIYDEYNEHMTAQKAFNLIFDGTGFNFILVDQFDAVDWEGFGAGESRLETFKRALERYKAEFRIVGNTVYLERQIGRDTQFQYRYRLNASNIVKEIDASALWTYAKGYGDYEDSEDSGWEEAKLKREYTSPLAKIIGVRHAPPIKDGRITHAETMDAALKELVDESLKISVSADIHDLRKQGYPLAQPELGDRVFLIDERIGLDDEIRVTDIRLTRNWRGEVIDLQLIFGSDGVTKRHQSNLQTAIKDITDIMAGRQKIPYSVLDDAVLQATKALQNAQTQLKFTTNGILAVDKKNPNYVTLFNSSGVGVSTDGGATFREAITGQGINASTISTGTMLADFIAGGTLSSLNGQVTFNLNQGRFEIASGGAFVFTDPNNGIRYSTGTRSSGAVLTNSLNYNSPMVAIGVDHTSGVIDANSANFSGLRVHSRGVEYDNNMVGNRFLFIEKSDLTGGGFVVASAYDSENSLARSIYGWNADQYQYNLGRSYSRFNRVYLDNIYGNNEVRFLNIHDGSDIGWVMKLTYEGNPTVDFFPQFTGNNYYNIGRSDNRINRFYGNIIDGNFLGTSSRPFSVVYTNTLVEGSDINIKDDVVPNNLGLDFINDLNTVDFTLDGIRKNGLIAQDVQAVLTKHDVDLSDQSIVVDGAVIGISYTQLIAPLIKAVQELSLKIDALEGTA